jgi:hypothetical protein
MPLVAESRLVTLRAWIASICVCILLTANAADPTLTPAPTSSPASSDPCGPYPKNYRELTWNWMRANLVDPDSVKVEWQGDPTCSDLGKNGQHEYGWLVNFTANSRNRFGAYTGKQKHGVLIRNGEVVKGIGFGY